MSSYPEGVAYPGLVLIGLALAGGRLMSSSDRRGWIALAAVGVVLSFGPYLLIGTKYIELPLPYMLVRELPFMDTMRVPGRFALLGVLALCVLAAGPPPSLTPRHPKGRGHIPRGCPSIR